MPIDVSQIMAEMQAEERARSDQDLARHHEANAKLQEMFDSFEQPSARQTLRERYAAKIDRQRNGIDILVRRIGDLVCTVNKHPGHDGGDIRIDMGRIGGSPEWFSDPARATKRVVHLVAEHQTKYPTREDLNGSRSSDDEGGWKTI